MAKVDRASAVIFFRSGRFVQGAESLVCSNQPRASSPFGAHGHVALPLALPRRHRAREGMTVWDALSEGDELFRADPARVHGQLTS